MRVIIFNINVLGFEYVVTKREQEKICFGAGTIRKMGDVKVTKVSPCSYETKSGIFEFLNKVGIPLFATIYFIYTTLGNVNAKTKWLPFEFDSC